MKKKILEAIAILLLSGIVFTSCKDSDIFGVETDKEALMTDEVKNEENLDKSSNLKEMQEDVQTLLVHVCGAVKTPGVYALNDGDRISDAVDMAGGIVQDGDADAVNLAAFVTDGQQIRIPFAGEPSVNDGVVNINTASEEELCTIPGIGETRAKQILEYRSEHGPFTSAEDLMNVPGIKEGTFNKISKYIKV